MRKAIVSLFTTVLITGIACTKSNSDPAPATSKTPKEVLMASTWKKSEYKENGVTTPFFGACEMDDVISFSATSCIIDDGATKCTSPTSGTDTYFIDADNKTIRWAYGSGELSFNGDKSAFTFKRTGANTFEYVFTRR